MDNEQHYCIDQADELEASVKKIIEIFSKTTGEEIIGVKSFKFFIKMDEPEKTKADASMKGHGVIAHPLETRSFLACYPTPTGYVCPKPRRGHP